MSSARSASDFGLLSPPPPLNLSLFDVGESSQSLAPAGETSASDTLALGLLRAFLHTYEWARVSRIIDEFCRTELAAASPCEAWLLELGRRVCDTVSACVDFARSAPPYVQADDSLSTDHTPRCGRRNSDSVAALPFSTSTLSPSRRIRRSFMGVVASRLPPAYLHERLRQLALVRGPGAQKQVAAGIAKVDAIATYRVIGHPLQETNTLPASSATIRGSRTSLLSRPRSVTQHGLVTPSSSLCSREQRHSTCDDAALDAACHSHLQTSSATRRIPSEAFDVLASFLESRIMRRLHGVTYAVCSSDLTGDLSTTACLRALQWLPPSALDVPAGVGALVLRLAAHELRRMTLVLTPEDKLACLLCACQLVFRALSQEQRRASVSVTNLSRNAAAGGSGIGIIPVLGATSTLAGSGSASSARMGSSLALAGTDEFLPAVIYAVLQANPDHLVSTINYIERFRGPQLMMGKLGFCFAALLSSVQFLRDLGPDSVPSIPRSIFSANCDSAASGALVSWLDSQPT
jgi:hypothetical protein